MALTMLPTMAAAAEIDSGTCGDGLTWTLDDAGTLTVSGAGDGSIFAPEITCDRAQIVTFLHRAYNGK